MTKLNQSKTATTSALDTQGTVTASAPGKINLVLQAGKPDEKGYHPLYSIFETVSLRETCHASFALLPDCETGQAYTDFALTPSGYPIKVENKADFADAQANRIAAQALAEVEVSKHLAFKAASLLVELYIERHGKTPLPAGHYIDLTIVKRIPIAGGMAGGSADAAATLVAVNKLLNLRLSRLELEKLGRSLGADVPACLTGGISLGLGYGDHMSRLDKDNPTEIRETHHWVMLMSATGLSTPAVFQAFDAKNCGRTEIPSPAQTASILATDHTLKQVLGTSITVAQLLQNDLQDTAFTLRPDLAQTYWAAKATNALNVILSGSGPTIAMLAESADHASALAQQMLTHPNVAATLVTSGPGLPAALEHP